MRQHYILIQIAKRGVGGGRGQRTIPNVQELVEQMELSYNLIAITLEKVWQFHIKLNIYLSFDSVFTPTYLLKRNESMCPQRRI